jgi:hypothetical protein
MCCLVRATHTSTCHQELSKGRKMNKSENKGKTIPATGREGP